MVNRIVSFLDRKIPFWKQFFKFGIVGIINTLITFVTYSLIVFIFKIESVKGIQIANFIGYFMGVLNSLLWNFKWVFKKESSKQNKAERKQSIIKFISVNIITYLLTAVLIYFWIDVLNINKYVAQPLNLIVTVPFNFLLNKFWTFGNEKNSN